jgi:replicative DNA helicase|tara:strand:- start:764 stop:2278 length:1515 start_codon:yes stop_codon:yes gene_type:complete
MIFSHELEQHLLAGILKYPDSFFQISNFIQEDDFRASDEGLNKTIFKILKQCIEAGDAVDDILIAQRVKDLKISFANKINPTDFIKSLSMRKISESSIVDIAKDLKKFTVRNEILNSALNVANSMKKISTSSTFDDIIDTADSKYNSRIDLYFRKSQTPENIFDKMEQIIEERGNNPQTEFGLMGPHKSINNLYGSLLRPGNITVIVSRSGVGKTTFCLDYCTKVSLKYDNVPVLHFDNGEMSEEEIMMRQCAALSGVPMHYLETGSWRQNPEFVDKVRKVWPKVKNMKLYYYNVAGQSVDQMINTMRRFYFSKVGRGNKMIFSFDYIKTTSEQNSNNLSHWQLVGDMVTKFKNFIQDEIVFEDGPVIGMLTSVQSNRLGITNNRNSENVVDDESIVSLSDQITQFSSHLFSLRKKTIDELAEDPEGFGTHKLICFKNRFLGEDAQRALNEVELPDGRKKKNYINLELNNFDIKDVGDLKDMVDYQNSSNVSLASNDEEFSLDL